MNRLILGCLIVATIVLGTAASGTSARNDDVRVSAIQVAVTFDGMPTAYFHSVSGLKVEIEVVEFREGGSNDVHKVPGRVKYPNIVLKQGFSGAPSDLQKWALRVAAGVPEPRNGTIVLFDGKQKELARYLVARAWPQKWSSPDFDASSNEVAIETIEIVHEGLRLVTDP